jgi:hypothetical protein
MQISSINPKLDFVQTEPFKLNNTASDKRSSKNGGDFCISGSGIDMQKPVVYKNIIRRDSHVYPKSISEFFCRDEVFAPYGLAQKPYLALQLGELQERLGNNG